MKLYHFPLSGHAHRARLFFSLINADVEIIDVDLANGEHKGEAFLALNPFGQVPVLVDGDTVISDSTAILVYGAKKFGRTDWLPEAPAAAARVQRWLSVAAGELAAGPGRARLITVFGNQADPVETIANAHAILKLIESELEGRNWIIGGAQPTIADVALYSYISGAPEGNVDLSAYPRINAWLERIERLEGFVPFQKTVIGLREAA